METVVFKFEPEDIQIIRTFEFDEVIQRPSSLQFFPIEEQLEDAYIKIASKRGKINKFVERELRSHVETMHRLYARHIVATPEAYELKTATPADRTIDWIYPMYASGEKIPYSIQETWAPLTTEKAYAERNGFTRLLTALPHPFTNSTMGVPWESTVLTKMVSETGERPIHVLPLFSLTRTVHHENGTNGVAEYAFPNTADAGRMTGYYAFERPFPIPNPLVGHPLLETHHAVKIDITAPLNDVLPSLDAVLTHAVPVTIDPYGIGIRHLKPFGFVLDDIGWTAWKSRFPPSAANVEPVEVSVLPVELPPRLPDIVEQLRELYGVKYPTGLDIRAWLMNRPDGGMLMARLLLSQTGENGSVVGLNQPYIELTPPPALPDECSLEGLGFHEFLSRGFVRIDKRGKKTCVPLDFIRQEQGRLGYLDRISWDETTPGTIVQTYRKTLHRYMSIKSTDKSKTENVTPTKDVSALRTEIFAVLNDPRRLANDKYTDVKTLVSVANATYSEKTYSDVDGQFVLCDHTLAILAGDLERDDRLFYETWTRTFEGTRVCRTCGEVLSKDVFVAAEEYTDAGQRILSSEILDTQKYKFMPKHTQDVDMLRKTLDPASPFQDMLLVILVLLKIAPSHETLLSYIKVGLAIENALKRSAKPDPSVMGTVGIAIASLMIQSHEPPLVPKRTIGSRPLVWNGYPGGSPDEFHIVDSILTILQKTFAMFPTSFKGASSDAVKTLLTKKTQTRQVVIKLIDAIVSKNEGITTQIKLNAMKTPAVPPTEQIALVPIVRPGTTLLTHVPVCGVTYGFMVPDAKPTHWLSGKETVYKVVHSNTIEFVKRPIQEIHRKQTIPESEVKQIFKQMTKLNDLETSVLSDDWQRNLSVIDRLCILFKKPTQSAKVNTNASDSIVRDSSKAVLFALLKSIQSTEIGAADLVEFVKKDLTLRIALADVKREQKHTTTLRSKERHLLTERLQKKNDMEREITKTLIDIGLAGYLVDREDRLRIAEETNYEEEDVGPEQPIEREEGVVAFEGANEAGQYGDIPSEWEPDTIEPPTFFDEE